MSTIGENDVRVPGSEAGFAERVIQEAGLRDGTTERTLAWGAVFTVLACYLAGFLLFYPSVATNEDEAKYLRQARLLAEGSTLVTKLHPVSGQEIELEPSQYPVGTAALMAPFVVALDWRAAYLVPMLGLIAGILLTARWIVDEGRSPIWALVIAGFPASLVMGRVAMSDVPSLAIVALGSWLFWRGIDRPWPWWFGAGLVAGASMIVRESNVLPFLCLFAGTVLRGERKCVGLVAGGVIGATARFVISWITFGDPLYVKAPYQFAFGTIMERLPLYMLGLLVLVPGGLVFGLAYRGRRRPEVVATVVLFFLFYLFQPYGITASSFAKRLVIALRYFLPLLPLLAFATAESLPRLWRNAQARLPRQRRLLDGVAALVLVFWVTGLAVAATGVHFAYHQWSSTQRTMRDAILEVTGPESVLVTNWWATRKFTSELDRRFLPLDRDETTPEQIEQLIDYHDVVWIVLLDRSDSPYWLEDAERNAAFLVSLEPWSPELRFDQAVTPTDRLRIWRLGPERSPG